MRSNKKNVSIYTLNPLATEILGGSDSEMGSAEYLELIRITNERRENTPEKKKSHLRPASHG